MTTTWPREIPLVLGDIKIAHSLFALPFALASLWVAAEGWPGWPLLGWVILAMVTARTYAMAFNRWCDRKIDSQNKRTSKRPTASGAVRPATTLALAAFAGILFIMICSQINSTALACSPGVLLWLGAYSLTKRWTAFSHFFLGASLGLSPLGAWVAATGWAAPPAFVLGGAVLLWVAGFDIIYATQDYDFDKHHDLHSMVVSLGLKPALGLAKGLHVLCLALLAGFGWMCSLSPVFYAVLLVIAGFLFWEHRLVKPDDLSKVQAAFFTANGWVSMLFFLGVFFGGMDAV